MGEYNANNEPDGFVRLIDELGTINEGIYTPEGKRVCFHIKYNGVTNRIYLCNYKDGKEDGVFM